jgi:hypothetical protein
MRGMEPKPARKPIINVVLIAVGCCLFFAFGYCLPGSHPGSGSVVALILVLASGPLVGNGIGSFVGYPIRGTVLGFVGQFLLLSLLLR